MKFESKYEVGQILYEIKMRLTKDTEKCECCGQDIYHYEWYLDETEQIIHNINIINENVTYKVWRPYVYREMLQEFEIGSTYFTSKEDAYAEIARRNAELQGVK